MLGGLVSSNVLIFIEGMLTGMSLVYLWSKFGAKSVIVKSNDIVYDSAPGTDVGANKLVLLVRKDLKMGKGKVAAQCSHAAVLASELSRKKAPDIYADWKRNGQPKIILQVQNEEEMLELAEKAKKLSLLVSIVRDAGRTQVASGSKTVMAIGPGSENVINQVTGYLTLY